MICVKWLVNIHHHHTNVHFLTNDQQVKERQKEKQVIEKLKSNLVSNLPNLCILFSAISY